MRENLLQTPTARESKFARPPELHLPKQNCAIYELIVCAVNKYISIQELPTRDKGYRRACRLVEDEYCAETGHTVHINHATVSNRHKGMKSYLQRGAEQSWLTEIEERHVIDYTIETSMRGFP